MKNKPIVLIIVDGGAAEAFTEDDVEIEIINLDNLKQNYKEGRQVISPAFKQLIETNLHERDFDEFIEFAAS